MTYSRDIHGGNMDLESCLGRHEVARSNLGGTEDRSPWVMLLQGQSSSRARGHLPGPE